MIMFSDAGVAPVAAFRSVLTDTGKAARCCGAAQQDTFVVSVAFVDVRTCIGTPFPGGAFASSGEL